MIRMLSVSRSLPVIALAAEIGGVSVQRGALLAVAAVDTRDGAQFYTDVRAGDGLELDEFYPAEKYRSPDRPDERAALTAFAAWLEARQPCFLGGFVVAADLDALLAASLRTGVRIRLYPSLEFGAVALTADALGVIRLPRKEGLPSSYLWDAAEALGLRPPLLCHPAQGEAELGAQVIEALFERLAGRR